MTIEKLNQTTEQNNINSLKHFLFFFIVLISLKGYTQNTTHTYNNTWFRLFLNDKITEKLKWEFILQHRRQAQTNEFNLVEKQQLQSYWLWFHYSLQKNFKLSVSPLCYFETKHLSNLNEKAVKEWRWCVRIENQLKFKQVQLLNRGSLEYRYRKVFNENSFIGNFRARYMLRFIIPLTKLKERSFNFVINNEVLVQFGDAVKTSESMFDQNRTYAGFNYEIFKNIKLDIGYCYIYQERPSGKDFDVQNAIWVFLTFDNLFTQFKHKPIAQ